MTAQQLIEKLVKAIDDAIDGFQDAIPDIQNSIFKEIEQLLSSLDTTGGTINASVANIRKLAAIARKLQKIMLSPEYLRQLSRFSKAFENIQALQRQYFDLVFNQSGSKSFVDNVRKQAVEEVLANLQREGLKANVLNPILNTISTAINSNASVFDLRDQLKDYITTTAGNVGQLEKYTGQVTTDAISQFAGAYNNVITQDLGLKWSEWVGGTIKSTREICFALNKKRWIHVSERPGITKGLVDGKQIPKSSKTGLPYGMIPGTTADNLRINRGGYRCRHLELPVAAARVPKNIRARFE